MCAVRLFIHVEHALVGVGEDAGVVVERVHAAIGRDRVLDHPSRVVLGRDVGAHERGLPARGPHGVDGRRSRRLDEVGDDHARALAGEQPRGHPAHAAAPAGDDRDLVLEAHRQLGLPAARRPD